MSEVKPYSASLSYDRRRVLHAFRVLWPEAVEMTETYEVAAKDKEKEKDGDKDSKKEEGANRGSARLNAPATGSAGPTTTATTTAAAGPATSSRGGGAKTKTDVVTQRRAQPAAPAVVSQQLPDVSLDPYVQGGYLPPASSSQMATTKIVRSAGSLRETPALTASGRLKPGALSSQRPSSSGGGGGGGGSSSVATTIATGGAMVAMAVGGVVVGALTAGVGLVAPMVIVGVTAAAGGGGVVYGASSTASHSQGLKVKQVALVLALESKEAAEEWRAAIEAQIRWSQGFSQSRWMSMVGLDRRLPASFRRAAAGASNRLGPTAATKLEEVDRWTRSTRWRPWALYNGLRIYELDHATLGGSGGGGGGGKEKGAGAAGTALRRDNRCPLPCRRLQVAVRGTPLEAFIALVSVPPRVAHGVVESVRVVERLDDQSEVIHLALKPLFLWPTWTAPRDFCLVRYWRYDEDGTYIICYDSTTHRACPPQPGFVRGDMHAVYTISPKRRGAGGSAELDEASPECLVTHILQVDPRGWLWRQMGYLDAFVAELLLHALDLRDLLETDRFMAVHVDTSEERGAQGGKAQARQGAGGKGKGQGGEEAGPGGATGAGAGGTVVTHRPTVPPDMWGDVDATTFVVRGPNYASAKLKVPSAPSAFRLLGVDLFDLTEATDNIAAHPNNRVQAARRTGDAPPFVFVVQLQIPNGEQQLGYTAYFAPDDMGVFEEDTPLARVIKPFFFGGDNNYRDLRFKLIPKIVEGNWVVRKSVGSTPAILGTKLKQNYYSGPGYFELDVNIASSSVAAGVVRLAAGYAKTLVVDLALVIQGEEENELPERVVAAWRIREMDLAVAKRLEG